MMSRLGIRVESLTLRMAKALGLDVTQGVMVTDVVDGTAALGGLQKNDVIVEVERRHLDNLGDLEQALAGGKEKGQLLLRVVRQGGSLFVVISL